MSVKEPDFNCNLLDRFLVLLEHKNIKPVIYISKMDLVEDDSEMKAIQKQYQRIGFDFIFSLEELLPLLTDKITVFMGQTGVGKSTLLNRIAPQLHLETGEISDSLGRGRQASHGCKFRSCTHTHEPSCAVKEEVENGQIWQVRYDNYLQFLSEIENRRETYKKTVKRK